MTATTRGAKTDHLLIFPFPNTSHLRPLLGLALNLLATYPALVITCVVTSVSSQALDRSLRNQSETFKLRVNLTGRFRTITLPVEDDTPRMDDKELQQGLEASDLLRQLLSGTDQEDRWAIKPCLVIIDVFRADLRKIIHGVCEKAALPKVPVLRAAPMYAMGMIRWFQPDEEGGLYHKEAERYDAFINQGLPEREAVIKAERRASGELLTLPSLPAMYDSPQLGSRTVPPFVCHFASAQRGMMLDADGFIDLGFPEMDSEARAYNSSKAGYSCFGVGPQFSDEAWAHLGDLPRDPNDETLVFLDKIDQEWGSRSVLFGSFFWPDRRPEIIQVIVDTLIELDIPFVFAVPPHAQATLEPGMKERVHHKGLGIFPSFAPQIQALAHAAVFGFLSHAGAGGINEAILCEVPLIFLPFAADQPANAAYFSEVRRIGVRLFHFASGCNGEPTAAGPTVDSRPEVMKKELISALHHLRGDTGKKLRKEIEELREGILTSKQQGGTQDSIQALGQYFTA